jgi:hypothetical protein
LSRFDPVTTRWIISGFVFALLTLLLSGWRYRSKEHAAISIGIGGLSGFCSGLASDFFSAESYSVIGLITSDAIRFSLLIGPLYAVGVLIGSQLFGRASEIPVPHHLLALIAAAFVIGLPTLDGVLR